MSLRLVQRRRLEKCGCYVDTGRGDFMMGFQRRDGAKDGCNVDPGRVKL